MCGVTSATLNEEREGEEEVVVQSKGSKKNQHDYTLFQKCMSGAHHIKVVRVIRKRHY
jgi:hypothetical protein